MSLLTLRELLNIPLRRPDPEAEGQGLVEYALIIVFVAVVAVSALAAMGLGFKEKLYEVIIAAWPG